MIPNLGFGNRVSCWIHTQGDHPTLHAHEQTLVTSAVPASGVCQAGCAFDQLAQPSSAQLAQAFTGVAPRMCR
jgi:hypothetical protein